MLCEKYKLQELDLQRAYLARLEDEKNKRKRLRLLERGFKAIPEPEEEDEEPQRDDEIEDDPEEFEREEHER